MLRLMFMMRSALAAASHAAFFSIFSPLMPLFDTPMPAAPRY